MTETLPPATPSVLPAANNNAAALAIAGGGISGLATALYALKAGVPANQIHLFEDTERTGGKIQTDYLQGRPVNKGAEFIDTDQLKIQQMAKELGVPLVSASDQATDYFHLPNGKVMGGEEFRTRYRPLAERVIADKAAIARQPNGALARRLNRLSMDEYLDELAATTPAMANRGMVRTVLDAVTFKGNQVDRNIIATVKGMFRSEEGNLPQDINAFQFVSEHSATPDDIFASDDAYRVEGGTEILIKAMHAKLAVAGVHFHLGAPVTGVTRAADGTLQLAIGGEHPQTFAAAKFVAAVPTYALKNIDGLVQLGLAPEAQRLISATQYTNSVKFTIALKDGAIADKSNFFDSNGFQCWSSDPHQITFLANAEDVANKKVSMRDFMQNCVYDYAKAMGKPADSIFAPLSGETVSVTNPGKDTNCYCSPGKNQMLELDRLGQAMDALNANGVGIVGTFFPVRGPAGLSVGFMECGLNAAQHACDALLSQEQARDSWVARVKAPPLAQPATAAPGGTANVASR